MSAIPPKTIDEVFERVYQVELNLKAVREYIKEKGDTAFIWDKKTEIQAINDGLLEAFDYVNKNITVDKDSKESMLFFLEHLYSLVKTISGDNKWFKNFNDCANELLILFSHLVIKPIFDEINNLAAQIESNWIKIVDNFYLLDHRHFSHYSAKFQAIGNCVKGLTVPFARLARINKIDHKLHMSVYLRSKALVSVLNRIQDSADWLEAFDKNTRALLLLIHQVTKRHFNQAKLVDKIQIVIEKLVELGYSLDYHIKGVSYTLLEFTNNIMVEHQESIYTSVEILKQAAKLLDELPDLTCPIMSINSSPILKWKRWTNELIKKVESEVVGINHYGKTKEACYYIDSLKSYITEFVDTIKAIEIALGCTSAEQRHAFFLSRFKFYKDVTSEELNLIKKYRWHEPIKAIFDYKKTFKRDGIVDRLYKPQIWYKDPNKEFLWMCMDPLYRVEFRDGSHTDVREFIPEELGRQDWIVREIRTGTGIHDVRYEFIPPLPSDEEILKLLKKKYIDG